MASDVQILVTGATGLVGAETLEQLSAVYGSSIVGTSRRGGTLPVPVAAWNIGTEPPPRQLKRQWDVIVHTAADIRWTMTPEQATAANVATVAALSLIVGPDTHVIHISTAYAVGLRGDTVSSDLAAYRNTYEWSKAHAERLAYESFTQLTIVRPPLIVGRRSDGKAARFSGIYTILRAMTAGMVPAIVGMTDARLDIIPVDDLAAVIVEFADAGPQDGAVTIAGGASAPSVGEVIDTITATLNEWRRERHFAPLDTPRVISPSSWDRFFLPFVHEHLSPRQARILELLEPFHPYLVIAEPLHPTHSVTEVRQAISTAVSYWADGHPREAALSPRPWQSQTGAPA
jgi:nucleoside-diphosphate-sugar epimerase